MGVLLARRPDSEVATEAPGFEEIGDAMGRAVREALWRHKQLGESIVVWRDGQIVTVPPEEIEVERPEPRVPAPLDAGR